MKYLGVFFISMVPLIELRGAIPIALGMDLPAIPSIAVCVLGNMLPVPVIYFFAQKFLLWGMCGENQDFDDMDHIATADLL